MLGKKRKSDWLKENFGYTYSEAKKLEQEEWENLGEDLAMLEIRSEDDEDDDMLETVSSVMDDLFSR